MSATTDTYTLLRALVDELARCGMRHACTSPGSRSAPLVLTLAAERRLRCHSHVDERAAGFFALGVAKATGAPVAVACTSGTAVAELLPAVIEAREARVPLVVLSADRPAELRENGAGQAIDQLKIFGDAAKWFCEVELTGAEPEQLRWVRTLACRAYWTALGGRPGVVHLNFPLREPLVSDEPLAPDATARTDGRAYVRRSARPAGDESAEGELAALVAGAHRGVIVAGRHERDTPLGREAAAFAAAAGWPLLADPLSGARRGPAAIAHYDALLRDGELARRLTPDVVLRVGDLPVSKPLRSWLASLDARQAALDPEGAWQDPASVLADSFTLEPAAALAALARAGADAGAATGAGEPDWLGRWSSADRVAAEAILGVLGDGLSEPAVARELGVLLAEEATLFVASSMPVRDIETFWPVRTDPPRVLCNRGANGIDGVVSSALGAAAASPDAPVVLLIGDVALAHDLGGLLACARLELELTIVLLDNDGGGIFDFLPVAAAGSALEPEHLHPGESRFARHVSTPTGLNFAAAAALYGLAHERASDIAGFREALEHALARPGSSIVEVRGERAANVALHGRVWDAVSAALSR